MVNTAKPTKRAVNYESVRLHILYYEMYDKIVLGPKARPLFLQHPCPSQVLPFLLPLICLGPPASDPGPPMWQCLFCWPEYSFSGLVDHTGGIFGHSLPSLFFCQAHEAPQLPPLTPFLHVRRTVTISSHCASSELWITYHQVLCMRANRCPCSLSMSPMPRTSSTTSSSKGLLILNGVPLPGERNAPWHTSRRATPCKSCSRMAREAALRRHCISSLVR